MNAFADLTFSLLLGWVRGVIGEIWSLVTSGAGEGFIKWIGANWLWLTLMLCAAGTLLDYAVWLVRWKPYRRWMARLSALRRRPRGEKQRERRFNRGYSEGVDIGWQEQQPYESDPYDENGYDPNAAYAPADGQAPAFPAYDEALFMPPVSDEFTQPAQPAPRRRRAARRAQSFRRVRARLTRDDDEDTRMIDGLPPLVDKTQAYHTPVYPGAANVKQARREENDDDG